MVKRLSCSCKDFCLEGVAILLEKRNPLRLICASKPVLLYALLRFWPFWILIAGSSSVWDAHCTVGEKRSDERRWCGEHDAISRIVNNWSEESRPQSTTGSLKINGTRTNSYPAVK